MAASRSRPAGASQRLLPVTVVLLLVWAGTPNGAAQQPATPEASTGTHANADADAAIQQLLGAAQEAEKSGDYQGAADSYRKILALRPRWALIHQSLGVTCHLRGHYSEAIEALGKAIALDEQLWGAHLFLGMDYYRTNQFEKAIAPLKRSLELNLERTEPEARLWLGLSYAALGAHESAVGELRRARTLRANDVEVLYQLGRAYDRYGSLLFGRIQEIDADSSLVHLLQAERYASEGREELARIEYSEALSLRPDLRGWVSSLDRFKPVRVDGLKQPPSDARANSEMGVFLLGIELKDEGLLHLRLAAEASAAGTEPPPYVTAAREAIASADHRQQIPASSGNVGLQELSPLRQAIDAVDHQRYELAIPTLVSAINQSQQPIPRLYLARAYLGAGQLDQAESEISQLLQAEPDRPDTIYWLGKIQKLRAAQTLQEMIDIDPDSYRVHRLAGEQHEDNTEYEKALESYRLALQKGPRTRGLRYAIGNVYWKTRRYAEAEKWLLEELASNPHHTLAHYRLGSLYLDQDNTGAAISHLEAALVSRGDFLAARLDLGRALLAAKRYEPAAKHFEEYARGDPENDRVHYLLANAYRGLGRMEDAASEMKKYQELNRKRLEKVQSDVRGVSDELKAKPR
jgi:tetratricopeptide (TPR) repeat protein